MHGVAPLRVFFPVPPQAVGGVLLPTSAAALLALGAIAFPGVQPHVPASERPREDFRAAASRCLTTSCVQGCVRRQI